MIYFDVTKTGSASHRSGLTRVSSRLREELGSAVREITWPWATSTFTSDDWVLTTELFSEEERPGFTAFLESEACRTAVVFHDAIPLKHPHITWPHSVARHPGYMKLLAKFTRVWAVSNASREDLLGFWRWQGIERTPQVEVLALGADHQRTPRIQSPSIKSPTAKKTFLCIGILEPRKNQQLLLEVCAALWSRGAEFELHLAGRPNPHFGDPILASIRTLRRRYADRLHFHEAPSDTAVGALYAQADATLFPTRAEGCGLPLLESLWRGRPCICSDLPVLRENADGGGCFTVPPNDAVAWEAALSRVMAEPDLLGRLTREAVTRPLPTWAETAQTLRRGLI